MTKIIDLDELLANNPNVDAARLRERLLACEKFQLSRYRYNLVAPFSGRLYRHPPAQAGGVHDNTRNASS